MDPSRNHAIPLVPKALEMAFTNDQTAVFEICRTVVQQELSFREGPQNCTGGTTVRIFEYLCSSSKNWMEFQTTARLFEQPDGISNNCTVLRTTAQNFQQLHGCSNNRTEFRTTAQFFEQLDGISNNGTVLPTTARIFG